MKAVSHNQRHGDTESLCGQEPHGALHGITGRGKQGSPSSASGGSMALWHLHLRPLASRTTKEYRSALSHQLWSFVTAATEVCDTTPLTSPIDEYTLRKPR